MSSSVTVTRNVVSAVALFGAMRVSRSLAVTVIVTERHQPPAGEMRRVSVSNVALRPASGELTLRSWASDTAARSVSTSPRMERSALPPALICASGSVSPSVMVRFWTYPVHCGASFTGWKVIDGAQSTDWFRESLAVTVTGFVWSPASVDGQFAAALTTR